MKTIISLLLLLSFHAQAENVWIRGPGVSSVEFNDFLKRSPEAQSYVQFQLAKLSPQDPSAEELQWAQSLLEQKSVETLHSELENFEAAAPMSPRRRTFLLDLLLKIREKTYGNVRRELDESLCQWSSFPDSMTGVLEIPVVCTGASASLENFRQRNPAWDSLVLEDIELPLKEGVLAPVSVDRVYNWYLVSNGARMVSFRGTLRELEEKNLKGLTLVKGDCESFTHGVDDLELLNIGKIYFGDACKRDLKLPETSRAAQWYEKNKPWVIPVGLAIIGAAAYGLRGKTLVIEKPAFH